MQEEKIQTLHPDPKKTNKSISKAKYNLIKEAILAVLQNQPVTHKELFVALAKRLKGKFEGAIGWYGETVKLDLEARKIIARTNDKPQKYFVV